MENNRKNHYAIEAHGTVLATGTTPRELLTDLMRETDTTMAVAVSWEDCELDRETEGITYMLLDHSMRSESIATGDTPLECIREAFELHNFDPQCLEGVEDDGLERCWVSLPEEMQQKIVLEMRGELELVRVVNKQVTSVATIS